MRCLVSIAAAVLFVGWASPVMAQAERILDDKVFWVRVYERGDVRDWGFLVFKVKQRDCQEAEECDPGAAEYKLEAYWSPFGSFGWGDYDVWDYDTTHGYYRWDGWGWDEVPHLPYYEFDGWYFPNSEHDKRDDAIIGKAWLTGLDRWLLFYGEVFYWNVPKG